MKFSLRSRGAKFCIGGFAIFVFLIGLVAFWPSRKPELAWKLHSVTATNGAWIAEIELTNSGQVAAYVFGRCITEYAEGWEGPRTPEGFTEAIVLRDQTIAAGGHFRMHAIIPSSTTNWWIHARAVPWTAEAKLVQWIEQKGWHDRLPSSVNDGWRSRFERQQILVSAGPFTNSVGLSR